MYSGEGWLGLIFMSKLKINTFWDPHNFGHNVLGGPTIFDGPKIFVVGVTFFVGHYIFLGLKISLLWTKLVSDWDI